MPNLLANAALILWPVVAIIMFRKLPVGRALIACLLGGYLFLPPPPAMFDVPLLSLSKDNLPAIMAFLICFVMYRDRLELVPQSPLVRGLLVVFIFSPLVTLLTNSEPIYFGQFSLPGLQLREAPSTIINQIVLLLPFLLARSFLRTSQDLRDLMFALFIGGLVYSLPMLVEVRLSPQINVWIYGYFQHDFLQMMRFGGFRPIVFLYHGLWVAFFAMTALVAAAALLRGEGGRRPLMYGVATIYLIIVLVLCKSVASLVYAAALVPLVLLFGQRAQLRVAVLLAVLALAYPAAKGLDIVPHDRILGMAGRVAEERAASMQFRFENETVLLERAEEKPFFGWGIWGRNLILDENSGEIATVSDGRWIIVIGTFGWLGFLAEFGLLTLPVFLMWIKHRDPGDQIYSYIGPASLILVINVVDLIPNATLTPLTWLFAGALLGYAESHVPSRAHSAPAFRVVM